MLFGSPLPPAPGASLHRKELSLIHAAALHVLSPIVIDTYWLSHPKLLPNTVIISSPPSEADTGSVSLRPTVPRRGAVYENG